MHKYSTEFRRLTRSPETIRDLLDNCSFGGTFEAWERRKVFISQAIHRDGTILDVGCGNGFLLLCLQEWSRHRLAPYGIDINEHFIQKARDLFVDNQENFTSLDARCIDTLPSSFPSMFDFVYFSRDWADRDVDSTDSELIQQLSRRVKPGGRFILGLYHEDKERNYRSIAQLESWEVRFDRVLENPHGTNLVAWQKLD